MHLNMTNGEALAEYVRALQVVKRGSIFAALRGRAIPANFGVDCVTQRIAHGWWGLTFKLSGHERRKRSVAVRGPLERRVSAHANAEAMRGQRRQNVRANHNENKNKAGAQYHARARYQISSAGAKTRVLGMSAFTCGIT